MINRLRADSRIFEELELKQQKDKDWDYSDLSNTYSLICISSCIWSSFYVTHPGILILTYRLQCFRYGNGSSQKAWPSRCFALANFCLCKMGQSFSLCVYTLIAVYAHIICVLRNCICREVLAVCKDATDVILSWYVDIIQQLPSMRLWCVSLSLPFVIYTITKTKNNKRPLKL